jgi:hypothetical protein
MLRRFEIRGNVQPVEHIPDARRFSNKIVNIQDCVKTAAIIFVIFLIQKFCETVTSLRAVLHLTEYPMILIFCFS